MSYIAVIMPEQNEGREAGVVSLVNGADLDAIKSMVFGKGYGVQGSDDGLKIFSCEKVDDVAYAVPVLTFNDFAKALSAGELSWQKVVAWQRWYMGYVDRETKIITLNKENVVISKCFEKCGYKTIIKLLPR